MSERNDKTGLERSVLTYVDVSCQQPAKFYLIIDESYGKALFSVDGVEVYEHEIVGFRGIADSLEVVTRFSPHLPWRAVNQKDVYLQSNRVVMEREGVETKEVREFRKELIKSIGLETPEEGGSGMTLGQGNGTGVYL